MPTRKDYIRTVRCSVMRCDKDVADSLAQATLLEKFRYYRAKYGLVHATASYVGRQSRAAWKLLGRQVTRSYVQQYLEKNVRPMLNLGSGSHCLIGFLNVDIDPRADAYTDVTKPLPFIASSFVGVLCEEILEHLDRLTGQRLLAECFRILAPGGTLRITTPCLEYFTNAISANDPEGQAINEIFYGHRHRFIYSESALKGALAKAGFEIIRWSHYRDSSSELGGFDSHPARFSHSPLQSRYVEAKKHPESR